MPLWGNSDAASNSVKYGTELIRSGPAGSGNAAKAANNTALYANTTEHAFVPGKVVGQFAVTTQEMANTSGERPYPQHAGWQMRHAGTGPVVGANVTAAGTGFANGETVTVSGADSNATIVLTSNATSNLVSGAVSVPGYGFANVGQATVAFNREKHLSAITVGGTPVGYNNTDVIIAANGTVNATATVSTNSTGGFVTANVTITNVGLWANAHVAGDVAFSVANSSGGASAGSGATFAATLANSSGGTIVPILGGRAGRVQYETIIAMGSITSTANAIPANT